MMHAGRSSRIRGVMPDTDEGLVPRVRRILNHRIIEEPVWVYIVWITICTVLTVAIIWGILSGSTPCPSGTPGC